MMMIVTIMYFYYEFRVIPLTQFNDHSTPGPHGRQ